MSNDWVRDISDMHKKFGVHAWVRKNKDNKELMKKFLDFRLKFLEEELNETISAVKEGDAEEVVDGLIDLCVVAIGTLDSFEAMSYQAWNSVHKANMSKEPGVKESRPNPLGLPDLIKPKDWKGPEHSENTGLLTNCI